MISAWSYYTASKLLAKTHGPVREVDEIEKPFISGGPKMCQLMNNKQRSWEPPEEDLGRSLCGSVVQGVQGPDFSLLWSCEEMARLHSHTHTPDESNCLITLHWNFKVKRLSSPWGFRSNYHDAADWQKTMHLYPATAWNQNIFKTSKHIRSEDITGHLQCYQCHMRASSLG